MEGIKTATGVQTWVLDAEHTSVEFAVKHLMVSTVKGRFSGVTGTIRLDEGDLANSSVEVSIDVSSIDTRQGQRDEHLRSPDFFDVENYPTIEFRSRRVEPVRSGEFRVIGDLTIRGVTREVVLEVTDEGRAVDPWGGRRAGFSAKTSIDRQDFGLTWNQALETGGVLVGNEVKISIDVEAIAENR